MQINDLRERLSVEDIILVMQSLGADHLGDGEENHIMFRTICHCGDSHKLYFYKDSKMFHCYTNCGQLDIFNIVQNVLNMSFVQSISYIKRVVGINDGFDMSVGFNEFDTNEQLNDDLALLRRNDSIKKADLNRKYKILNNEILNTFRAMYHPAFYKDGISIETLRKFNIRYDILNHRIIIPHYDEFDNLIAVRSRNLDEELVERGLKYTPIFFNGEFLSSPTRMYFFGLNINLKNIKRIKKIILFESEKAVMQLDTILKGEGFAVALSSSSLHLIQVEILKSLGVEEVIIALDKEYESFGSKEEKMYAVKIRKALIEKLIPFFTVSVIWDTTNLLQKKDSPTDRGGEIFRKLYSNRIFIGR